MLKESLDGQQDHEPKEIIRKKETVEFVSKRDRWAPNGTSWYTSFYLILERGDEILPTDISFSERSESDYPFNEDGRRRSYPEETITRRFEIPKGVNIVLVERERGYNGNLISKHDSFVVLGHRPGATIRTRRSESIQTEKHSSPHDLTLTSERLFLDEWYANEEYKARCFLSDQLRKGEQREEFYRWLEGDKDSITPEERDRSIVDLAIFQGHVPSSPKPKEDPNNQGFIEIQSLRIVPLTEVNRVAFNESVKSVRKIPDEPTPSKW